VVQGAALAVAPHPGEVEDLPLAGGQQLLAGELRRGVQVERRALSVRGDDLSRKGVQVRLVAGGDLQGGGLHLDEVLRLEPAAQGRLDAVARQQARATLGVAVGSPPGTGWRTRHVGCFPLRPLATLAVSAPMG
jgi:hypothetical protein